MVNMTELQVLVEQYRADLEAELVLLVLLQGIAVQQQQTTGAVDIDALQHASDKRDALTSRLMAIERGLKPVHERLMHERAAALRLPGFSHATALHDTVGQMFKDILETDSDSIRALEQIVATRRTATQAAEQAEATLAAYGRMSTPRPSATLVNRRG
jgi:hypothetical protein